jgi:hypothetical protein
MKEEGGRMKTSQQQQFEAAGDAGGGLAGFGFGGADGQGLAGGDQQFEELAVGFSAVMQALLA